MEEIGIERLTELATAVLTSPDKATREEASRKLRFMSCYDYWDFVKALLPMCENNYLRFIVCKAIHFIVSNELGPQERREMQVYVLDYLTSMNERGEELPTYVRNELYSIYVSIVYINWRLTVISMEDHSKGLGKRIIDELSSRLPTIQVLECVLEVLTYFSKQESKGSLEHVRTACARDILPYLFQFGVMNIAQYGRLALEVSCTALETAQVMIVEPIITVRLTTDDSIYLDDASVWFPALPFAMQECATAVLALPMTELTTYYGRFLRMGSTLLCVDQEWFQVRNTLSTLFLELSGKLLELYLSSGVTYMLQLGCELLINLFERDEGVVTAYIFNRPELVSRWAEAAWGVLDRWKDDEEELRQELMRMFFLFGDRVIPRVVGSERDDIRASPITADVLRVAHCYFDTVVAKAHLTEDSNEMRSDVGVMLHNEKTLLPVAEMLFWERLDLYPTILERLMNTIKQYEACIRAREISDTTGLGDVLLSLAVDVDSLIPAIRVSDVPLFLMHVCLSRLSVIISIVAISMLNERRRSSDDLIGIIAQFAQSLLSTDDALTSAFLEDLSLADVADSEAQDINGVNGHNGNTNNNSNNNNDNNNNNNNNNNSGGVQCYPAGGEKKVHLGMLRALFFFCGCVYESQSGESRCFYEIMINLLRYVYLYHSDKPCLATDANNLLGKVLGQVVRGCFLTSDKMTSILLAVKDEQIELLRASSDELTADAGKARSGFLSALTFFVESRYYAGFSTLDLLQCIIARALEHDRLFSDPILQLRDLLAIADGIHQPEGFFWMLEAVIEESDKVRELLKVIPSTVPLVLRLCAKMCNLASLLLREDHNCEMRWNLVGFCVVAIAGIGNSENLTSLWETDLINIGTMDAANEMVLYDVADIVYNLINSRWCNLGVMLMYTEDFLDVFKVFVSLFLSTSVELLMSRKMYRERIFHALMKAFLSTDILDERLRKLLDTHGMWQPLLSHLTKCLHYTFLIYILAAIDTAFMCMERSVVMSSLSVSDEVIGDVFQEVAIFIAVSAYMEPKESELCFNVLIKCFQWTPTVCSARMESLLDFCSAYHRVRLRHIFTLLRSGKADALMSYVAVFGRGSKVHTLSAW
ncbi:hypothetical protein LSM04_007303 [Trypanosoma melophagium]|uniref:uncharacterized protein n=1 Tax=Trypanosoma melophagium TaxID=715481 RepID=UPI003519E84D|nr:hypothetical protein LSM04_007303 [Trypanosoma melophagium]